MDENRILEEELAKVSGGILKGGWEDVLTKIMKIYKAKNGDGAKQQVKDLMAVSLNDQTSSIDENDIVIINEYIDNNWQEV